MQTSFQKRSATTLLALVPRGITSKLYAELVASRAYGHAGAVLCVMFWTAVDIMLPRSRRGPLPVVSFS